MYIDVNLINMFQKRYGKNKDIEDAIKNNGIWFSADGIRAEEEDFDLTLEDIMSEYYFVVENNKILFCSPEEFINHCDEYY